VPCDPIAWGSAEIVNPSAWVMREAMISISPKTSGRSSTTSGSGSDRTALSPMSSSPTPAGSTSSVGASGSEAPAAGS